MIKEIKLIYLDQYDAAFRQGYDAACVVQSIRESLRFWFDDNVSKAMYVNIHKDSLPLCQGLCAENLFYSIIKNPPQLNSDLKNTDEVWLMLKPSKMLKR
jgi:hypothetical protein